MSQPSLNHLTIQDVAIIGSGQMGQGIAQIFALSGFRVILIDSSKNALKNAYEHINESCLKLLKKGIIADINVLDNIHFTQDITSILKTQIIIEAVPEVLDIKLSLYKEIEDIMGEQSYFLCTNTSSFSITALQKHLKNPKRFLGMHFMNPPVMMPLVELVMGKYTDSELLPVLSSLVQSLKKEAVVCKDIPGFIINRILIPMINEACLMVDENVASCEDIDKSLKLGARFPMGPLELADYIGLDTVLAIMKNLKENLNKHFKISKSLEDLVLQNKLGRKTGEGFFRY
jgi:3-hydroxybutyryl-CoA dehydrogenase